MKTALQLPNILPNSLEFGGMTTVEDTILFENGSVLDYLPSFETQAHTYFDDWGCTSNSFESGIQVLIKRQINDFSEKTQEWLKETFYKNNEPNFSNRDLIVLSGTVPRVGNSGDKVLKTAQDKGLIPQTLGDWDSSSRDINNTEKNFYLYGRTKEAQLVADEWNKRIKITGEWASREKWKEASKRGVLQVYVNAWYLKNGKYYNPNGKYNHAVLMADYNEVKIYDSYRPEIKQLESWADAYYNALKINIEEKTMEKPKIENNSLLQLVEGKGGFGMYLDGKIYIDDTAKILASVIMRNGGNLNGKIKALTQEQWDMFDKYNLKGEKL
jgi:hypothetical protein